MSKPKLPPKNDADIFDIDQGNLDGEWINQPRLYFEYSVKLADARADLEQAKAEIDIVYAELDQSIREKPASFGLDKLTEAGVKGVILSHSDHKKAVATFGELRHRCDVLGAYVAALDHRKKALEKLVDLEIYQYNAQPKASKMSSERMREVEERSTYQKTKKLRKED